ncbi:MAG: phospholipase D family protein [Deltaproteobacteria bacterium]|nr:phospholipase D family protein [Deltaproteobacteria bacterium]
MSKKCIRKGIIFIILAALLLIGHHSFAADLVLNNTPVRVCFSPGGDCTANIVQEIDAAKTEILVQAYSFTSAPIAKALLEAKKRGIHLTVILDKSQRSQKYTSARFMQNSGIPVYIDDAHALVHNKIITIDRSTVITGSFNFTKAAEEKNAENLLIIKSPALARIYTDNWVLHWQHSDSY